MARPASRSSNAGGISLERHDAVMSASAGMTPSAEQLDGALEVVPLVDAGAERSRARARTPAAGRSREAAEWMATTTIVPAHLRQRGRGERRRGGGSRHLEHDVGAGAVRSTRRPRRPVGGARVDASKPSLGERRRRAASSSTTTTSAPECAGDDGDEDADRAAAERRRRCRPTSSLGAPYVVDRDGDGLDERGGAQVRRPGAAGTRGRGGHVPERLQRAGGVDADEVEVLADVRVAREAGGAGAVPDRAA